MKESLRLRKQKLEQDILQSQQEFNKLERMFNIWIKGTWIVVPLMYFFTYSNPVFIVFLILGLIMLGLSLVGMLAKKSIVTEPRKTSLVEFEIKKAQLDEEIAADSNNYP